jgi:hypothetical protein
LPKVPYVFLNVSGITQRGSLGEYCRLAKNLGCNYIEVPADFLKNKTKIEKTRLNLGDFLIEEMILMAWSIFPMVVKKNHLLLS